MLSPQPSGLPCAQCPSARRPALGTASREDTQRHSQSPWGHGAAPAPTASSVSPRDKKEKKKKKGCPGRAQTPSCREGPGGGRPPVSCSQRFPGGGGGPRQPPAPHTGLGELTPADFNTQERGPWLFEEKPPEETAPADSNAPSPFPNCPTGGRAAGPLAHVCVSEKSAFPGGTAPAAASSRAGPLLAGPASPTCKNAKMKQKQNCGAYVLAETILYL